MQSGFTVLFTEHIQLIGTKLMAFCMMMTMALVVVQSKTIPRVNAQFCNCAEILVKSAAGALEHLPESKETWCPIKEIHCQV